jgi:hypothetical protein
MPEPAARTKLEPLAAPVMTVAVAHVLLGLLIWFFLPFWQDASPRKSPMVALDWRAPDDFLLGRPLPQKAPSKAPVAPRPQARKAAPSKAAPAPKTPVEITGPPAPKPPAPAPSKPAPSKALGPPIAIMAAGPPPPTPPLPVNRYITVSPRSGDYGASMASVDEAVQKAYLSEWLTPPKQLVPASRRSVSLEVTIGRDGTILEAKLPKTGEEAALDASVQEVAARVKKIPVSLPSTFPKERYDLRVNFQIE